MMTCREVLDFVMAYFDGELTREVREEFERHLAVCPPCADYLTSYRRTIQLEKEAFAPRYEEQACADVPEDLVQAILASRKR